MDCSPTAKEILSANKNKPLKFSLQQLAQRKVEDEDTFLLAVTTAMCHRMPIDVCNMHGCTDCVFSFDKIQDQGETKQVKKALRGWVGGGALVFTDDRY